MIIYKITNKINGKVHIGQTIHSLDDRWQQHIRNAKKGVRTHFYSAIRKYGENNFEPEVICEATTKEELNLLETYYIQEYDSIDVGYNMVDGGNNNVMFIPEVNQHHKDVVRSEENRTKISNSMKKKIADGDFFKPEHRKKLSDKAKGNKNGEGNPSHSIPCFCVQGRTGKRVEFRNIKEAGLWWYNTYHPFGEKYSQATYQRKILEEMENGYCMFRGKKYTFDIHWYRK